MAKLPTPDFVNNPKLVQEFGIKWMEKFYQFYPPSKAFNVRPGKYDIDFACVKGINESFIISRYGFAINTATFYNLMSENFKQWKMGDGVYYPIGGDGKVGIYNKRDSNHPKEQVFRYDYKKLCDDYLSSSHQMLTNLVNNNKFW